MTVEHNVKEDPNMDLMEWKYFIDELIAKYGPDAKMYTDGGYNNVTLWVTEE